jgi:hypothetical protein
MQVHSQMFEQVGGQTLRFEAWEVPEAMESLGASSLIPDHVLHFLVELTLSHDSHRGLCQE